MIIKRLKLQNYKGFKDGEILFDPKLTVIVGKNGAGKTTILEAIVKTIYSMTSFLVPDNTQFQDVYQFTEYEINHGATYAKIELDVFEKEQIAFDKEFKIVSGIGDFPDLINKQITDSSNYKSQYVSTLRNEMNSKEITIPVFKFYPANRASISYMDKGTRVFPISQLETWWNIYHNSLSQNSFFKWLYEVENKELRKQKDDKNYIDPLLEPIREAILKAFNVLNNEKYDIVSETYKRAGTNNYIPTLALKSKTTGKKEILQQKSEGEKSIITLVSDIVYNLAISSGPNVKNVFTRKAVIMIDEIEAHLHPDWQKKIIKVLRELFPNVQFIISSHSPQVISSVQSNNIISIENYKVNRVGSKTFGFDTNNVLQRVFNTDERPDSVEKLYTEFYAELSKSGNIDKLNKILKNIEDIDELDGGSGVNPIIEELKIQIESHKYDLENEADK